MGIEDPRLFQIDARILALQEEKRAILRENAREQGKLADSPEELFPDKENLVFVIPEVEEGKIRRAFGYHPENAEELDRIPRARAHFCEECEGWIKGEPLQTKYDEIGPLCGSRGFRYFCRVCDSMIAEVVTVRS